jgi:Cu/Ag efflux protein CusF
VSTDRGESAEPLVVKKRWRRRLFPFFVLVLFVGGGASFIACQSQKTGPTPRYHLTGKISDVDKRGKYVLVEQDDIPGYMPAMTMSYPVKDPRSLDRLSTGDVITADVVVSNDGARLENIEIVKKGPSEGAKPSS